MKARARQEIMHYVLSFCTSRIHGASDAGAEYPRTYGGIAGFVSCYDDTPPEIGDLVLLSSAPSSKWQIGWLIETRVMQAGWPEYLIESLEDGSLCWWGNVGLSFLQRRALQPRWRWTDRQFAFNDRWQNVCYKQKARYIVRPVPPVFGEGYEVTLGTRAVHALDDIRPTRTYPDWRKVTKAKMAQCYEDCVAERERILIAQKAMLEPE